VAARKLIGPRKVILDAGVDPSKNPIWIEGPHLYRRGEWYYLMCAEGGTGPDHSEVILRSRSPWGPFEPFKGNPILTQRDLPRDRPNPITNAGHADLVEAPDGSWWAVFLASRTYDNIHYNTGRETWLLPVEWRDGWPIILDAGKPIPYVNRGPQFMRKGVTQSPPLNGNFTWRDEFNAAAIDPLWVQARVPKDTWADLRGKPGWLTLHARPALLSDLVNPSFLARRQQHIAFEASTALELPADRKISAGLAAFQSESYWYFLGARRRDARRAEVFLESRAGKETKIVATSTVDVGKLLRLRVTGNGRDYSFFYDTDGNGWKALTKNADGTLLSTETAGGFVGAMLGPYARAEH
jgi:alpha-N-arabinofuranosidase